MSSNASVRLNFCFVHRLSTSTLHEPATTASNHPRAPARTKSLRLIWPRIPCQPSLQPLPAVSKPTTSRCNYRPQPPTAPSQIIRTCSTIYKTHRLPRRAASFKSLYLKRPYTAPQPTPFSSGASDTALRLPVTNQFSMVGIELGCVCFRQRATTLTLSVARWGHNSAMATFSEAPL